MTPMKDYKKGGPLIFLFFFQGWVQWAERGVDGFLEGGSRVTQGMEEPKGVV